MPRATVAQPLPFLSLARTRPLPAIAALILSGCVIGQDNLDHDGPEYPDNTSVMVYKYRITNADGTQVYLDRCGAGVNRAFPGERVRAPVPLGEEYVVNVTWAYGPNEFNEGCDNDCYCTRTDLQPGSHWTPYPGCWRSATPETHELLGVKVFDANGVERTAPADEHGLSGLWGDVEQYRLISHVAGFGSYGGLVTLEWGGQDCIPWGYSSTYSLDLVTVIEVE